MYNQLMNEANILKSLKHNNIPIIYDIEEDDQYSYIIEEYIEGISLKTFRSNQKVIDEDSIVKYALQLCELMQYLHSYERKILYLDLKPDNIIVSNEVIKLIDFGNAIYSEDLNTRRYATGTIGYASPEQYKSNLLDERSDIYGLGMLLFFLVTGISFNQKVHSLKNIDEIHSCSNNLRNIINKCLKFNPSQRYKSVVELKNNLITCNKKYSGISIKKSTNTLSISIAGSQSRVGVTHISFLLTTYFNQYTAKCLYSEKNNTQAVNKILQRYHNVKCDNYIYQMNHCYMIPNYNQTIQLDKNSFSIEIKDYGVLTENNLQEYEDADYKLILVGSKDWELDDSEVLFQLPISNDNLYYLFNFIDSKAYQKAVKNMGDLTCYRIPYEPDPFKIYNKSSIELLVNEIFNIQTLKLWERFFDRIRGKK